MTTYAGGAIPFLVVGGQLVQADLTRVAPAGLERGGLPRSPAQVEREVDHETGTACRAAAPGRRPPAPLG